jgi:hypothetical protein
MRYVYKGRLRDVRAPGRQDADRRRQEPARGWLVPDCPRVATVVYAQRPRTNPSTGENCPHEAPSPPLTIRLNG